MMPYKSLYFCMVIQTSRKKLVEIPDEEIVCKAVFLLIGRGKAKKIRAQISRSNCMSKKIRHVSISQCVFLAHSRKLVSWSNIFISLLLSGISMRVRAWRNKTIWPMRIRAAGEMKVKFASVSFAFSRSRGGFRRRERKRKRQIRCMGGTRKR